MLMKVLLEIEENRFLQQILAGKVLFFYVFYFKGWVVGKRPIVHMCDLSLMGECFRGAL